MISLHFPTESLARLQALGIAQRSPQKLRWTNTHPASSYGLGVLIRGHNGPRLDGADFAALVANFGTWIECGSELERQRVAQALGSVGITHTAHIRLAESRP